MFFLGKLCRLKESALLWSSVPFRPEGAAIISCLKRHEIVLVVEKQFGVHQDIWFKVLTSSGIIGFVYSPLWHDELTMFESLEELQETNDNNNTI